MPLTRFVSFFRNVSPWSLRAQLVALAVVPLLVLVSLASLQAVQNYERLRQAEQARLIQRLATAGAGLATALPDEVTITGTAVAELQARTDAAFTEVFEAYQGVGAAGISSPAIDAQLAVITSGRDALGGFRQRMAAGTAGGDEALFVLQPISAAGVSLVAGAGAVLGELDLARLTEGLHALLQTNDAGLIEAGVAAGFLETGQPLAPPQLAFAIHAKDLRQLYRTPMLSFLPAEVLAPYHAFANSGHAVTIEAVLTALHRNEPDPALAATAADWTAAADARGAMLRTVLDDSITALDALSTAKVDGARNAFIATLAIVLALVLVIVGVSAGVVAMTMAARKIPVQIPRRVVGRGRVTEGQKSFVPLRINSAGVMPIIFAQSIIIVPGTIAAFTSSGFLSEAANMLAPGTWLYNLLYAVLIVFFTYFYTAIIFNPVDLAENLKKQGAFVPGVKPGARTAEYIDRVLTRISFPGSLFLAAVAILPQIILDMVGVPFLGGLLGGTGLLIVVGVGLDTVQQMQQHLLLRHYDGFMKRGRVKFRGRQRYM